MYYQIKQICNSISKDSAGNVWFEVCSGVGDPLSKVQEFMRDDNIMEASDTLKKIVNYPGYGILSFKVGGPKGDLVAYLELVKEMVVKSDVSPEVKNTACELMFVAQDIIAVK